MFIINTDSMPLEIIKTGTEDMSLKEMPSIETETEEDVVLLPSTPNVTTEVPLLESVTDTAA
jgi:hypothetical protein